MNPKIFANNSFKKDHFNIWSSVLPKYIEEGIVTGHASSKFWLDVGTIERLKLANTVYNDEN
jgi:MurNAc alpha-1-phosphate uridylyltransferase